MTMMGSSSGPGPGPGSSYRLLDPHRVYELVIRRKPRDLLDFLASIPEESRDLHWHGINLVGKALLDLLSQTRLPSSDDEKDIDSWAQLAQFHATQCRFSDPVIVHNPSSPDPMAVTNFPTIRAGIRDETLSSTSGTCSGHNAIPVINFPTIRAGIRDETVASTSGTCSSAYVPSGDNAIPVINFSTICAGIHDETVASTSGTCSAAYVPSGDNAIPGGSAAPERRGAPELLKPVSPPASPSTFPSSSPTPAATLPLSAPLLPCRPERRGSPELLKPVSPPASPSTSPSSSPTPAATLPLSSPLLPRRRTLPLRTCQIRIPRQGSRPLNALGSQPLQQTPEIDQVDNHSDPESADKETWPKALKSWSDDDE